MHLIKEQYQKNKPIFVVVVLLLTGFIISGTIMAVTYYNRRKKRGQAHEGIGQSTIDFVSKHEGRRKKSYKDTAGLDTVGVGHLIVLPGEEHLMGRELTDTEIDTLLAKDLRSAADTVTANVKIPLSQNQFDALVSLVFNIGNHAFKNSTLLKWLNEKKERDDIENAWKAWNYAGGVPSQGLTNRREDELKLFYT